MQNFEISSDLELLRTEQLRIGPSSSSKLRSTQYSQHSDHLLTPFRTKASQAPCGWRGGLVAYKTITVSTFPTSPITIFVLSDRLPKQNRILAQ